MKGLFKGIGIGLLAGVAATAALSSNRRFTREAMKNAEKAKQALNDMFDNVGYVFRR